MSVSRRLVFWGLPALIALGLASLAVGGGRGTISLPKVDTSFMSMLGDEAKSIPAFLKDRMTTDFAVIVSSADEASVREATERIRFCLGEEAKDDSFVDFLRENRSGLVTAQDAELLATAQGRTKIAKRALRSAYSSPVPPVLGFENDPFGLTQRFLMSLKGVPAASIGGGETMIRTNGIFHVLMTHCLPKEVAASIERLQAYVSGLELLFDSVRSEKVKVRICGAAAHTARSAANCKRDVNVLSVISIVFIALLALVVFRSVRWIPYLAMTILVAAAGGTLAVFLCDSQVHLLALVFGTTLIGLVIDYAFHSLLSSSEAKPCVWRGLAVSLVTTEISLAPLALSSLPLLRTVAVFLGAGLFSAFALVRWGFPLVGETRVPPQCAVRWRRPLSAALCLIFAAAIFGAFHVRFDTTPEALYRPPADLRETETLRATFGTFDVGQIPDLAQRLTVARDVASLYAEHAEELAAMLGIKRLDPPPEPEQELCMRPQEMLSEMLSQWTGEALSRLGIALTLMFVFLLSVYRTRAIRLVMPSLIAICSVVGIAGCLGRTFTFFHVLAVFLLVGMSIDYTVFLHNAGHAAFMPAFCSLLTSAVGFGALAFVSFPVVSAFGFVLGIGLPVSFAAAATSARGSHGVERGATTVGLGTLWCIYRLFGLPALHFVSLVVAGTLFACSPGVRKTAGSWRRLANFVLSLADKLAVMSDGRSQPKVRLEHHPDAEAFLSDVRSRHGVFVLSSHVGAIETLVAIGECACTFHAWMDFTRTAVFTGFYRRHFRRKQVVLHSAEEFGLESFFEAGTWIDEGEVLLMAGDRGEGAFRFAAAMNHPVYFVACVREGDGGYLACVRRLPEDRKAMAAAFDGERENLARKYPEQCYDWFA